MSNKLIYPLNRLKDVLTLARPEHPKENIPGVWDVRFIFGNICILMISFGKHAPTGNFWWQFDPPSELSQEDFVKYLVIRTEFEPLLAAKAQALVDKLIDKN